MRAFVADDQSTPKATTIACSARSASNGQLVDEDATLTVALTIAATFIDCSEPDAVVVDSPADACQEWQHYYDSNMAPYRSAGGLHRCQ